MTRLTIARALIHPNALLAIVGLLAGTIGAIAAGRLVQARVRTVEGVLSARYLPREVVVAAQDLEPGQRIESGMIASRKMPRDFLPAGALATTQAGSVIGRRINVGLRRGDPLQLLNLTGSSTPALSEVVRNGGRAMTISVDDTNSMSGLLRPGDVVDLYYSRSQGDGSVLVPLLDRVEVLAAGESLKNQQPGVDGPADKSQSFATITVHVSPEDGARLVLAQATGTITVLLRSPMDGAATTVESRNSRYLLARRTGNQEGERTPTESVELIVGGSGSVVPEVSLLNVGSKRLGRTGGRS